MDKIGYMGIPGSFSEVAANELLAQAGMTETELVPLVCAKNNVNGIKRNIEEEIVPCILLYNISRKIL